MATELISWSISKGYVANLGFEFATPGSPVRRATHSAMGVWLFYDLCPITSISLFRKIIEWHNNNDLYKESFYNMKYPSQDKLSDKVNSNIYILQYIIFLNDS